MLPAVLTPCLVLFEINHISFINFAKQKIIE